MLPVTIWMNMPSFYQDDLFRALADRVNLRVVFDHALTADRRQLGWSQESSGYQFRILNSGRKMREAASIAFSERDRLHVVNGIWAEPAFALAALVLGMERARFAIYAEAPNELTPRSAARSLLRNTFGRWVAKRACGLLAVSHFAADYYNRLGFNSERIYSFGYFRSLPTVSARYSSGSFLDIVFLGQLVHRKGVDILIEAAIPVLKENPGIRLSLIGAGSDEHRVLDMLRAAGTIDRVTLEGVLPPSEIQARLARADLLVLPSRWDGWGLVINEAFSAGVPVIASDRCGAADLITHGMNGYVFQSEQASDLRSCLRAFLAADRQQMSAAAIETSKGLTIPVVADYLLACVEHMSAIRVERPMAPWQTSITNVKAPLQT